MPTFMIFEVAAWFHPLVEYSNDLNQSRLNRAIVENMNRLLTVSFETPITADLNVLQTARLR